MTSAASRATMASRVAPKGLDDFPTPPWATRVLTELLLPAIGYPIATWHSVREPCANRGLMVGPLLETGAKVIASDVWDYGVGFPVEDYLATEWKPYSVNWCVMNPPFAYADAFLERALVESKTGVAMFNQARWAEGVDRFGRVFSVVPPSFEFQFSERVCLKKGHWDPAGSTATSYCWFIWLASRPQVELQATGLHLFAKAMIPPGQKLARTRPGDKARFAGPFPAPLFDQPGDHPHDRLTKA